jgi:hypothetical protein
MTLGEVISSLDSLPDDLCIAARRPWSADSKTILFPMSSEYRVPAHVGEEGYEYFLEVYLLRNEVLEAVPRTDIAQRIAIAIYYAENDAYPLEDP